jgi:hypothetical protein
MIELDKHSISIRIKCRDYLLLNQKEAFIHFIHMNLHSAISTFNHYFNLSLRNFCYKAYICLMIISFTYNCCCCCMAIADIG